MEESARRIIRDYGLAVGVAAVLALGIRFFWIEAYRIPTQSMRPALDAGDTIFVHKAVYGIRNPFTGNVWIPGRAPVAGEVVVFAIPDAPDRDAIKRVVAVAGQDVEIKRGHLWINGKNTHLSDAGASDEGACSRERLPLGVEYGVCFERPVFDDVALTRVPDGHVFVLGDLRIRPPSDGTRVKSWGVIPISAIKAQARWIWLSVEGGGSDARRGFFSVLRFDRMFRRIE